MTSVLKPEQERVKKLLTEAVTLLCRSSLNFQDEVAVEGLIGITLDQKDIFLVSIRETVQSALKEASLKHKRRDEDVDLPESPTAKRRKRKPERSQMVEDGGSLGSDDDIEIHSGLEQIAAEPEPIQSNQPHRGNEDNVRIKQEQMEDGSFHGGQRQLHSQHRTESDSSGRLKHISTPSKSNNSQMPSTSHEESAADSISRESIPLKHLKVEKLDNEEEASAYVIGDDDDLDASGFGMQDWGDEGSNSSNLDASGREGPFPQQLIQSFQSPGPSQAYGSPSDPNSSVMSQDPTSRGSSATNVPCPQCSKRFSSPHHMQRHYRNVHLDVRRHSCALCGDRFKERQQLDRHFVRRHTTQRNHVCHCGQAFAVKADMVTHYKRHCKARMELLASIDSTEQKEPQT